MAFWLRDGLYPGCVVCASESPGRVLTGAARQGFPVEHARKSLTAELHLSILNASRDLAWFLLTPVEKIFILLTHLKILNDFRS